MSQLKSWKLGNNTLVQCDCRDEFRLFFRYDVIFYDPPYEIEQFWNCIPSPFGSQVLIIFTDSVRLSQSLLGAISAGWEFRFELIWDTVSYYKAGVHLPLVQHRSALVFGKRKWIGTHGLREDIEGGHSVASIKRQPFTTLYKKAHASSGVHYAKPVEWLTWILRGFNCNTVVDAFAGTGSGFLACHQANATCTGYEINEEVITQCITRWEKETRIKAIPKL